MVERFLANGRRWTVSALAAGALFGAASPAAALNDQCLTGVAPLPFLAGPPTWFDPAPATTTWRAELHDPRWAGARIFNLCGNPELDSCALGTLQAQVRAIIEGTTLYVQFVNVADDGQSSSDAVFIGVGNNGTAGARLAKISLDTVSSPISPVPVVVDAVAPIRNSGGAIYYSEAANANAPASWAALSVGYPPAVAPATVSWLQDVATWTDSLGGTAGTKWGVTFKIDLTQFGYLTAPISAEIPLFFGSRHTTSAATVVPLPNVLAAESVDGSETIVPANKANWAGYSGPASGCNAGGVRLDYVQVGVVSGGSLIGEVGVCPPLGSPSPPATCPGRTHTFRAEPDQVPNGVTIKTRMRLANFGSFLADPQNAPWEVIPGSGDPLNNVAETSGTWTFDAAGVSGVAGAQYQCAVASGQSYCPVLSNVPTQRDQCLLVEMAGTANVNVKFENSAVYRNLYFRDLSSLDVPATINIKGLQAATGKAMDRDVYLYVQTDNMRAHTNQPMALDQKALALVKRYAENRPPRPIAQKGDKRVEVSRQAAAPLAFQKLLAAQHAEGPSPFSVPTLSSDQALTLAYPTYKVHAYYDTGTKVKVNGAEQIVLQPMVPFGFYLNHLGEFFGFSHSLTGMNGVVLESIGPNWYRLRLKNEGSAQVRVKVSAEEAPKGPDKCCCETPKPPPVKVVIQPRCYCSTPGLADRSGALWGSAGLALLGVALARRRRRPAPRG